MKTRFAATELSYLGKNYKEGSIEIDDESLQITLRAIKKSLFSKNEVFLDTAVYGAKSFPQFMTGELTVGKASCLVQSDADKERINAILSKPLVDLGAATGENLRVAEASVRKMLLGRAESLEYLIALRANPRKTLFQNTPEILANSDTPIETAISLHKEAVSASLSMFKEEVSGYIQRNQLDQVTSEVLLKLAIAVMSIQNAVFQSSSSELRAAEALRSSLGLTLQISPEASISAVTAALVDEFALKNHQTLVNNLVGMLKCRSCGKFFEVNVTKICPYCNSVQV